MATEEAWAIIAIFFLIFLIFVLVVLFIAFWIWMIVDCAKRDFKKDNDKVAWILVIVLAGWIGAIIYYFVIKIKDKKYPKR